MEYTTNSNVNLSKVYKKINAQILAIQKKWGKKDSEKIKKFRKQLVTHNGNIATTILHVGLTYIDIKNGQCFVAKTKIFGISAKKYCGIFKQEIRVSLSRKCTKHSLPI